MTEPKRAWHEEEEEISQCDVKVSDDRVSFEVTDEMSMRRASYSCTPEEYLSGTATDHRVFGLNTPVNVRRKVEELMSPAAAAEIEQEVRRTVANPARRITSPEMARPAARPAGKKWWEFRR